jgi:TonB family protein
MRDRVADVLAQRATLDRGAGPAIALSVLLHAALAALAAYGALHASAPEPASFVTIKFAPISAAPPAAASPRTSRVEAPKPVAPKIEEPKPKIEEPKPVVAPPKPAAKPEKNTVPFSPFGRSTKKGSETAAPAPPVAAPATTIAPPGIATTTADVPVGGTGVTGLEGGDFPYAIYIQGMNRKIGGAWARPQVTPGTTAIVYFRIQRNGAIVDATIETPSGNGTFDRAALSAVRSASPLNPLPFGYSGPFLGVRLTFK